MFTKIMKNRSINRKQRGGINISDAFLGVLMFVIIIAAAFMNADTILNYARWGSQWMELESMKTAASTYRGLNKAGTNPSKAEDLITGLSKDKSIDGAEHTDLMNPKSGRWSNNEYKDAWGNSFVFTTETTDGKTVPVIISRGIDGVESEDDLKVYY